MNNTGSTSTTKTASFSQASLAPGNLVGGRCLSPSHLARHKVARDPRICLRKPQQRAFRWFWSMSRKFVRERNICWRWTRVVASSSKFLPSSRELVLLPRCVMKREIPVWNKSDLHSAGVMICVDWPHSPACKKFRFSRASKQAGGGLGLARVWIERSSSSWPPGRRRSGLLKSALDSEPVFRRQLPHSQRDARADQVVPASTSHQARSAPAGETGAGPVPAFGKLIIAATGDDQEENGISSAFTCADGFRGCFDPWPSLSNKYHRSRGNTIIRSRQGRPFVGGVRSR